MAKSNPSDVSKVDIEALKKVIRALESPKVKRERERAMQFELLYEGIRNQLAAGVSKSTIVAALVGGSMSISNSVFDKLLAAEAKRRGEPMPGKDDEACEGVRVPVNISPNAPQAGAKEEVTE